MGLLSPSNTSPHPSLLFLSAALLATGTSLPMASSWIPSSTSIRINEIAHKGGRGVCGDGTNDWIELYNAGADAVDLSHGYVLYDDKGMDSEDAFRFSTFENEPLLEPEGYIVLCTKVKAVMPNGSDDLAEVPDPSSPQFGIGSSDTITLVRVHDNLVNNNLTNGALEVRNFAYELVSHVGPLPNLGLDAFDITYAYDSSTGTYNYTSTPTPAAANVMTPLKTLDEVVADYKAELARQNANATDFFNMDDRGLPVPNGMDDVLNLYITLLDEDYDYLLRNTSFEVYRPFQSIRLTTTANNDKEEEEIASFTTPGRIRPKGQASLYMATCLNTDTIPYQVDMGYTDPKQTFFGLQKFFLRNNMADNSYMRDWAYNRMLARYGLPHLRTRTVQLFMNNKYSGLYTFTEAPDQEYVFARNFPTYTPDSFALYKVTNLGVTCGNYTKDQIASAALRMEETSTPPYAFQRGEHRPKVAQLGLTAQDQCIANYWQDAEVRDKEDVILAWLRHNKDCAKMRLEEGLIDRDLGTKNWDNYMQDFVDRHLNILDTCDPGCTNSHLKDAVDVDNFLRTTAFYAVTLNLDSPLGPGNNYYLVQTGDGSGWKLQAYDFNYPYAPDAGCQREVCNERLIHWSIVRPTCRSLEENKLVGPLLTDPELHEQYLNYVADFLETVYSNSSLIEEMTNHVNAVAKYAKKDIYSTFGIYMQDELSVDASDWDTGRFPLLPTIKARASDVRAQLSAIDAGTFERGPIVRLKDNEPWEVCPDWRESEPNSSKCELGCHYVGCHMEGWTVPSYCDEETGTCYHGDYDEGCHNIVDGEQYSGMTNNLDGSQPFCRYAAGFPVSTSECLPFGGGSIVSIIAEEGSWEETSQSSRTVISHRWDWTLLTMLASSLIFF